MNMKEQAIVEGLAAQARGILDEVGAHRAAGRKLLERIEYLERELNIAVPDEGDLRFDSEAYSEGVTSILAAASGLETGLAVPDSLSGFDWDWHGIDLYDTRVETDALQPSEV